VSEALESDRDFVLRHGYTYSGHPTACAAGLKNIEIIEKNNLLKVASGMGYRLERGLQAIADDGGIDHVRGMGALFAVGLREDQNAMQLRDAMIRDGVITRAVGTDTITYCPPFVTTDEQVDTIIDVLAQAVA
jgi:putrescine aminotransferase